MKIGVDMFGNQERNRGRGIGRYTRQLVTQLLTRYPRHEYVLYYHEGLPGIDDPWPTHPTLRTVPRPAGRDPLCSPSDYLTRENPDGLDVLILSCAFDCHHTHLPPPRTVAGPTVACVLYDLIPALSPEKYLADETVSKWYYWTLRLARQYDCFLAISEASRLDGLRVLGLSDDRVVNVGTGSDGSLFFPDPDRSMPAAAATLMRAHGLRDEFVFSTSGADHRKNLKGLMRAFAQLPAELRQSHQLLVTCSMSDYYRQQWLDVARELGIIDRLVLIADEPGSPGYLNDEVMRALYQRCAAFVFPSLYEGFGLPILEALQCGAPVIAGRNSSQPEVVGDAGLLANVCDPADLAAKLTRVLADAGLAASLRAKGPIQARKFTWEAMADRAMAVIEELGGDSPRQRQGWLGQSWPGSIPQASQALPASDAQAGIAQSLSDGFRRTRGVGMAHHELTVGNTQPTPVGRPAGPSEAKDGLEGRPTSATAPPAGASTGRHAGEQSHAASGQSPPQPPNCRAKRRAKPRIAFFSPLSPLRSDVVDYAESLIESLRDYYTIDLFHDAGYLPHAALAGGEGACHDYRLFGRFQRAHDYAGIVYHTCDSPSCGYIYETLQSSPGVVVMHDHALPEFHLWYADHAASVLVHDKCYADELRRALPDLAERVFVAPIGAELTPAPDERRLGDAAREHVPGNHDWSEVAARYVEAIEWTRDNRRRWSGVVGRKTSALARAHAASAAAAPALTQQPVTGTTMKRLTQRVARAAWRKTAGVRERLWAKLRAEIQTAVAPGEARRDEAIADLNRLTEGLLREVLRLQSQVGELARRDCDESERRHTPPAARAA